MPEPTIGPRCGNNPNAQLTDGDRKAIEDFRAYLTARTALRDRIAEALEQADYRPDMRRGDLADAVLPALYQDLPWLRDTTLPASPAAVLQEAVDSLAAAIRDCPARSGQCLSCEAKAAAIRELRRIAEAQQGGAS